MACRTKREQTELVRVRRASDGSLTTQSVAGRSAYVCPTGDCLDRAEKSDAFARALKSKIEPEAKLRLARELKECQR